MKVKLEGCPIVVHRAISWGQMDAFQHLNNVEYLRFFEDARIAYFEAMGIYKPGVANAMNATCFHCRTT